MTMLVFKPRSNRFFGIRRQDLQARLPSLSLPEELTASLPEVPVPIETASRNTLNLSKSPLSAEWSSSSLISEPSTSSIRETAGDEHLGTMEGYRPINCKRLSEGNSKVGVCAKCSAPLSIVEDMALGQA